MFIKEGPMAGMRVFAVIALAAMLGPARVSRAQTRQDAARVMHSDGEHTGTDVMGAVADSLKLLMIEHGTRITLQPKTRRELGGPFFADYRRSIRWPGQWGDTDGLLVNYLGHPIHGAAAGLIWVDHGAHRQTTPGAGGKYWTSRAAAAAFSAVYSVQFEVGPLSEASIGNVGMRPETTGWVDHLVTPAGAFGLMVAEDLVDHHVVRWVERRTSNRMIRATVRIALNPSRALANLAQSRTPWSRPGRPLNWQ
jgi:hypothetical protein